MNKLYLKNINDEITRVFRFNELPATLVLLKDSKRLQMVRDTVELDADKIDYDIVTSLDESTQFPLTLKDVGELSDEASNTLLTNVEVNEESNRPWHRSIGIISLLGFIFAFSLQFIPQESAEIEEELKQHVVKIIKKAPKIPKQQVVSANFSKSNKKVETKKTKKSVRRVGALKVLGRLNKRSKNKGGLNLGAVKTTAGPGLGGTQGSGGVQTSLYAKGLVNAPVGPGNNIKGGGGYGTKGKGGGQDGYGTMSLVGSTGTASIPLGKEAIINGGLDQSMISAVIQKNMGQIRFCYEQGLQSDPKLSGRVAVNFVIGASGQVTGAKLNSSTLHSQIVENCILMRLKTWKFPNPEGGVDVKVSYPFMLRRLGSG